MHSLLDDTDADSASADEEEVRYTGESTSQLHSLHLYHHFAIAHA